MKIAVIANLDKEISINTKGGSELFTYLQVQELAQRPEIESIDVFALGKNYFSSNKVIFHSILPTGLREFIDNNVMLHNLNEQRSDFFTQFEANVAVKLFEEVKNKKFDVIQNNSTSAVFNSLSSVLEMPFITTLHTNVDSPSIVIPYSLNFNSPDNTYKFYVAISNFQKKALEPFGNSLKIIETIYNGIDTSPYTVNLDTSSTEAGLWIGRISQKHNKGLKEAMQVSNKLNSRLTVLGSPDDNNYYEQAIKPLLTMDINLITDSINVKEKADFYAKSSYLLYPIMWEEPFGLIFLESMASGTPVIAYARGAVPEIIVDGVTGFIVNPADDDIRGDWIIKKTGIEGLCEAVQRLNALSPAEYKKMRLACREHVENNFTITKMVDGYSALYTKIVAGS